MKSILLIGLGKFGFPIAKQLSALNQEVMAIDKDEKRVNEVLPYVTNAQIGDSTSEDFLRSIGARNFDVCIVAIGNDFQSSLETVSMLKEMGAKRVVARAVTDIHAKFLLRNGADDVVQPDKQIAEWIAIRYTGDHVLDFVSVDNDCAIFEVSIPKAWVGKSILDVNVRHKYNVTILGIRTDNKLNLTVSPNLIFPADSTVMMLGRMEDMRKFYK